MKSSSSKMSKWLEWHVILGPEANNDIQINFILDCIKPLVEELEQKIESFHFVRHYDPTSSKKKQWKFWPGFSEIEQLLDTWSMISLVIFSVRVRPEDISDVKEKTHKKLKEFDLRVYPVYKGEVDADVKEGLEDYGGDVVHPIQHEYFHYISKISLKLLEKARNGKLKNRDGNLCGTEDVARQWSHILLNQLGIADRELVDIISQQPVWVKRSDGMYIPALIYDIAFPASKPMPEIKPVVAGSKTLRPFGLCAGKFTVPDDFDDPLPESVIKEFEGS